jgi:peptidoglycan/LPS O-acetylase OafA/YrhL
VAWFFVLSGFLIVLPFAHAAVDRQSALSARGFLARRAIRIVPLYYVASLTVWALRYTGGVGQWRDLLEHLTFTQIFDQTHIFWTLGPAWSLAVEALFYLVVAVAGPLAVRACGRLDTSRARMAFLGGGAVALGIASVAYKWWAVAVAHIPAQNYPTYFGLLAKLNTFALGMLLAVAVVAAGRRPILGGIAPTLLRLAGGALLAMTFVLRTTSTPVDLYFHTLSGVAFALVLASTVLGPRGAVWERLLAWPPLQVLGLISYSLYLWHEPLLIGLGHVLSFETGRTFPAATLVLLVASIAVALLSYRGLEYPTLLLRHLSTREGQLSPRYPVR